MKKKTIPFISTLIGFCTISPQSVQASPAPAQLMPARLYQAIQQVNAVHMLDKTSLVEIVLLLLILICLLSAWAGMQGPSKISPVADQTREAVSDLSDIPAL